MPQVLSTFRSRYTDRASILRSVIETHGPKLFSEILQKEAIHRSPRSMEPISYQLLFEKIFSRPLGENLETLRTEVRQTGRKLTSRAQQVVEDAVQQWKRSPNKGAFLADSIASVSGFALGSVAGMNLPNVDVRFFSSDTPEQSVVFHSAPRLFSTVALKWLQSLLKLAALAPSVSPADRRFFEALSAGVEGILQGLLTGTVVRDDIWKSVPILRGFLHREQPLAIDAHSLKMTALWVQDMIRQHSGKG